VPPPKAIDESVYTERVRVLFQQMPVPVLSNLVNAALTAAVLVPFVREPPLFAWFSALASLTVARCILLGTYRRGARQDANARRWAALSVAGSLGSGLCWGTAVIWFVPADEVPRLFIAVVIAGMCAGSVALNSVHLPSVAAFVLPSIVPLTICLAVERSPLERVMAVMAVFFTFAVLQAALRSSRIFGDTVRLQLKLAERTEALDGANSLLRTEIAQHQATEAALRHVQKMDAIGRLTAGIAHDFNNLLMAISGSTEVLQRRLECAPEDAERLATIRQAAERGTGLTRQLLAFGRQQALHPEAVDLNQIVRDSAELLTGVLGRTIGIDLRLDPDLSMALVDPNQIEHAILNLAINARDAMPHGGTLTMATANSVRPPPERPEDPPVGPCLLLAVSDTGVGMTEEVLAKAFDPFFTTKEPCKGSGLGLSQVYGIVHQSGGATRIETSLGSGTTVKLYLPRAQRLESTSTPEPSPRPSSTAAGRGARVTARSSTTGASILLLDDDPLVRFATAGLLRADGHVVVAAGTAQEALAVLRDGATVALFIADFAMPDMRGDEVARQARLMRPSLPVLFITGYADVEALRGELSLQKPFNSEKLRRAVASALVGKTSSQHVA
jgi:signal transduction histidine kinase/ActR/RegA family two-component response regulator